MKGIFGLFACILILFGQTPVAFSAPVSFNWQPIPMQSGEIANIVWSPSDPNILYLGVEVNSHSFYKSTDGGRSWRLIDRGDHAKDVAVHPANPDIAFYSDSQSLWRTISGGERLTATAGRCDPSRERCASAFQKVIESRFQAGPTGFSTIAIARSNPQIVYVGVPRIDFGPFGSREGGGQLHKSTDGGETFQELTGTIPGINAITVHPTNPELILIGAQDGIYLSSDGGKTLKSVQRARAVVDLATPDGKLLLAATEEGMRRSTDGGQSWQLVSGPLDRAVTVRVRFSPSSESVVWATTTAGVFRSQDAGSSWQEVSGNLEAKNLQALVVHPTNPEIALVATDTFTFSIRSDGLFHRGQYYGQGVFRTEDGGKTWNRSDDGIYEYNLEEVSAHPSRPFEIWAGQQSSRGMYRSKDAGQTWSLSPGLLTHYPMRFVFSPKDPDTVYHTSSHIMEDFGTSTDSGINWTITSESAFFKGIDAGQDLLDQSKSGGGNLHIHGLAVDPKNPNIIYAGSIDDPARFNPKPLKGSHLFKSTDNGRSWTESDEGYDHAAETSIHDIKIDPSDQNTVYFATTAEESKVGNGIWKSSDAGLSWQRANQGMANSISVQVILIHPKQSNLLLAGAEDGIYRSADGASSWQKVSSSFITDLEFDPTEPEVVYASSEGEGLLQSRDFGESWTNVTANLPSRSVSALAVNATGQIVYAGTKDKGLFVTIDPSVGSIPKDTGKTELGQGRGFGPGGGRGGGPGYQPPTFLPPLVVLLALTLATFAIFGIVRWRRGLGFPKSCLIVAIIVALFLIGLLIFAGLTISRILKQIPSGGPPGFGPPGGGRDSGRPNMR